MLPKITDYWDQQVNAIERMSAAVLELAPPERAVAVEQIQASIARHVAVFDDDLLLRAAVPVADDLYKAACWIGHWDEGVAAYLGASSATFWSLLAERGFTLQYLVDNVFETLERPLNLFPVWYEAAGLVYISPQAIARELMQGDAGPEAPFDLLLPRYNREARHVAAMLIDRCHDEQRSFALVDADFEEETFRSAFALAGKPGMLTIFRNEAADAGTNVSTWFPG